MSEVLKVPDGLVTFEYGGTKWDMDHVGTLRQITAIQKTYKDDPDPYAYHDGVRQLIQDAKGPAFNDSQLDWFVDKLHEIQTFKKKERAESMRDMLKSLSSSE